MPLIPKPGCFTPEHLKADCRETRRVLGLIHDSMEGLVAEGRHQVIAAGLHRAALSHLWSITLLFDYVRPASAFALLRSCIETSQRALYVQFCHDAELLTAIDRDDRNAFGAYKDMLKEIEDTVAGYRHKENLLAIWPDLCSYCHGCVKQISRQFNSPGQMAENFESSECVVALSQTTSFVAHVTYLFLQELSGLPIRADIFWAKYLFKTPW